MAITYPLELDVLMDTLEITSASFVLNEPVMSSGDADGTIYDAANGSAMWQGSVKTGPTFGPEAQRVEVLMDLLRGAGRTFFIRYPLYLGPQNDPYGSLLAGRKLAIEDLDTTRIKIGPQTGQGSAKGFPKTLKLLPGDMIGFEYGTAPTRYALHRVAPGRASYGHADLGVSIWIDVVPMIRPGAVVGGAVTLVSPVCKAVPIPGSITGGDIQAGGIHDGWSFDWRQTLR